MEVNKSAPFKMTRMRPRGKTAAKRSFWRPGSDVAKAGALPMVKDRDAPIEIYTPASMPSMVVVMRVEEALAAPADVALMKTYRVGLDKCYL